MSNKQYLEYDRVSGAIVDGCGTLVANFTGFVPIEVEESQSDIVNVIKLKDAGFTADEIIAMKKAGI